MDLETENRIAAILMKEAAELRRQSEKEGVNVYLRQPNFRGRPNSRFLTATVLGVQQSNRAVEVNEMWRVRQKELELDDRLKGRSRDNTGSDRSSRGSVDSQKHTSKRHSRSETSASAPCSSSTRVIEDCYSLEDEGLQDDEIDKFLHSRVKRGRGAIGSRMDEAGPYLPPFPDTKEKQLAGPDEEGNERWEPRVVLGPEKPSSLKPYDSSEEESLEDKRKKAERVDSSRRHSKKHKSKEKSRNKNKNKREKRHKHRKENGNKLPEELIASMNGGVSGESLYGNLGIPIPFTIVVV